jgi:hypothetical protein
MMLTDPGGLRKKIRSLGSAWTVRAMSNPRERDRLRTSREGLVRSGHREDSAGSSGTFPVTKGGVEVQGSLVELFHGGGAFPLDGRKALAQQPRKHHDLGGHVLVARESGDTPLEPPGLRGHAGRRPWRRRRERGASHRLERVPWRSVRACRSGQCRTAAAIGDARMGHHARPSVGTRRQPPILPSSGRSSNVNHVRPETQGEGVGLREAFGQSRHRPRTA